MSTTLNIAVDQGTTLDYNFMVLNENGTAFNLTGYSASLMVRKSYSSSAAVITATTVNAKLAVTSAVGGQLTWHIIPADTASITFASPEDELLECLYDLEITSAGGAVYKAAKGTFTIYREITR